MEMFSTCLTRPSYSLHFLYRILPITIKHLPRTSEVQHLLAGIRHLDD